MRSDWSTASWGELIELKYGKALRDYKNSNGEFPVFGTNGPVGWCEKPLCDVPGIIIGRKGAYRGVHFSEVPFFVIDTAYYIQPKGNFNIKWAYYHLLNQDINNLDSGSAIPSTSREDVYQLPVTIPPRAYQDGMVKVLDDLNQKIQLNHQISQTLEQMAQAIFKSWFVDFEPVKAKIAALDAGGNEEDALLAAMQVISGKDTDQLTQMLAEQPEQYAELSATAELFPSAMQDSELGEIPEGWEARPFGDCLSKTIGGDWGKDLPDEKHTEEVKILRGTDLPKVYSGDDSNVPTRFVEPKKLKTRRLQPSDIVIEVSGGSKGQPTGRSLYLTDKLLDRLGICEPASFCRLFRPSSENIGLLLALHLQRIYAEGKTWLYQNQSTGISNFQTKIFLEHEQVVLPTANIQEAFSRLVKPMIEQLHSNENTVLSVLRDTLLPKLLSGELTLPDNEEPQTELQDVAHV